MFDDIDRVEVNGVNHPVAPWCVEERCRCGGQAGHKVEETTGNPNLHPMTAYLCCKCFNRTVGYCTPLPEPTYCCDEYQQQMEEFGQWMGGSHYHCGRCNGLCSMMGHWTTYCKHRLPDADAHFCCPGDCELTGA